MLLSEGLSKRIKAHSFLVPNPSVMWQLEHCRVLPWWLPSTTQYNSRGPWTSLGWPGWSSSLSSTASNWNVWFANNSWGLWTFLGRSKQNKWNKSKPKLLLFLSICTLSSETINKPKGQYSHCTTPAFYGLVLGNPHPLVLEGDSWLWVWRYCWETTQCQRLDPGLFHAKKAFYWALTKYRLLFYT